MDNKIYLEAVETIEDVDNLAVVSDLGITVNGTLVDVIEYQSTWDGDYRFVFYAGNPTLDGTDQEEDWEELDLSDEEQEEVLNEFILNF